MSRSTKKLFGSTTHLCTRLFVSKKLVKMTLRLTSQARLTQLTLQFGSLIRSGKIISFQKLKNPRFTKLEVIFQSMSMGFQLCVQ